MTYAFLTNQIFVSIVIATVFCEVWKFIDASVRSKRLQWKSLVATGGMPSSHATFTVSIATAVGLVDGFTTGVFFVAVGIAMIVIRDAIGVRRDVDTLRSIVNKIARQKKIGIKQVLKITGHTPVQVFTGTVLGILIPILVALIY